MDQLFSEKDEPFTLADIAATLKVPYKRLHYCYKVLSARPATRDKVQPLDGRRPLLFSAAAANLIARNCRYHLHDKKQK